MQLTGNHYKFQLTATKDLPLLNILRDKITYSQNLGQNAMSASRFTRPRPCLRLWREQDGVTALEFAIIAPVFLLVLCAIIEFSMIMFTTSVMEGATSATARMGKTGYSSGLYTRQQTIVNNINARTAGLLDASKITMTTMVYSDFTKIGQPEPCITHSPCNGIAGVNFVDINGNGTWDSDMGAAGLGNPGDVVVYTVSYPWPILSPIMRPMLGSTYNITVRTVIRNEPFGTPS